MTLPAERLVTTVYAFEWCDCVFESAHRVVSLHATKVGAYRAMRACLLEETAAERQDRIRYGNLVEPGAKMLQHHAWRVRTIEVMP